MKRLTAFFSFAVDPAFSGQPPATGYAAQRTGNHPRRQSTIEPGTARPMPRVDPVPAIVITGGMDTRNDTDLNRKLGAACAIPHPAVVADLSGLMYLRNRELCVLVALIQATRRRGGDVRLAAVPEPILDMLKLSGLTEFLKCYGSVGAAVSSFSCDPVLATAA